MPTAAFATLGCKVNLCETERLMARFAESGFRIVSETEEPDVYVVNTCSVTAAAEAKSRKLIRRLSNCNPRAVIMATGCDVEMAAIQGRSVTRAALVVPNRDKPESLERLLEAYPHLRPAIRAGTPPLCRHPRRTRAMVKVQDGCDQECTYCSVPLTRGKPISTPTANVLSDVEEAVRNGHREIVVTGVLVGAYGEDLRVSGTGLPELLRSIARTPGVERVRLSSIEPTMVTDRLIEVIASEPGMCPHLHIPLQSGDDSVLRAMNRPYAAADYLRLCERAAAAISDLSITTDVLVGFPGETRAAFTKTVQSVREAALARLHVFRFSPRTGTPAAEMPDRVPESEKTARSAELADVGRQLQHDYANRYVGRVLGVVVEDKVAADGHAAGYTPNYIRVQFPDTGAPAGSTVWVRITEVTTMGAAGAVVTGPG